MLADKLNMSVAEAERWIVNLIRNARLDAKIDSKMGHVMMGTQAISPYEQVWQEFFFFVLKCFVKSCALKNCQMWLNILYSVNRQKLPALTSRFPIMWETVLNVNVVTGNSTSTYFPVFSKYVSEQVLLLEGKTYQCFPLTFFARLPSFTLFSFALSWITPYPKECLML